MGRGGAAAALPAALDSHALGAALAALAAAGDWEHTGRLLRASAREQLPLGAPALNGALRRAAKASQWVLVLSLHSAPVAQAAAAEGDARPPTLAYASHAAALKACRRLGNWEAALHVLQRMGEAGVPVAPIHYSVAMAACLGSGDAPSDASGGGGGGDGASEPALRASLELLELAEAAGQADGPVYGAGMQVRRDRGLLVISASFTYDGGHSSAGARVARTA
jgi:pentatricopeptide repeat protein